LSAKPIEIPVEGISDEVIRLRLRTDADTPAIVAACRDPDIARFTRVPDSYDETTAGEWAAESQRQRDAGAGLHLIVAGADEDDLLGSIGIRVSADDGRCDLGYWLAPWGRGRGVMTRAVRLLSRWTFQTLPVERIEVTIEPENSHSRAVVERAGYTFEGVLRSYLEIKGRRRDAAMYSLLRDELR
jgi:[ribosomal protein S5]-alanine N-acetyltransferase